MRREHLARVVTAFVLLAVLAVPVASRLGRDRSSARVIDLVARQPAAGGWSHERIVVERGERVRFRIRSEDVVHGFAIGRLGVDAGLIEPGKTTVVEFDASEAGEFTFYCTAWCDPNHPRMRGVIDVRDGGPAASASPTPRDVALHNADLLHVAPDVPPARPSAARGERPWAERCAACHGRAGDGAPRGPGIARREWLDERSPAQIYRSLTDPPVGRGFHETGRWWGEQDRWDVVAHLWSLGTTPARLERGQRLYSRNCAACHGETGAGDGPGGRAQPKAPAKFAEPRTMLGGTTALYTAKIRRGGMGTGMPYWGSIFTEGELGAVVDYLWTFSLGTDDRSSPPVPSAADLPAPRHLGIAGREFRRAR